MVIMATGQPSAETKLATAVAAFRIKCDKCVVACREVKKTVNRPSPVGRPISDRDHVLTVNATSTVALILLEYGQMLWVASTSC